jgi:hypothetical protein
MTSGESEVSVPEDHSRLKIMELNGGRIDIGILLQALREDLVVLVENLISEQADNIVYEVADALHLSNSLRLQAGFAGFGGHRHNIGKYYMSVNQRDSYQFITPHSEGNSFVGMELASFFCHENSTDGGETILMNIRDSSKAWQTSRESVKRARIEAKSLTNQDILRARGLYNLNLPADVLRDDDIILQEYKCEIPNLTVVDALAKPQKSYSRILNCELYGYWDSLASIDLDAPSQFAHLLRQSGLLREPPDGLEVRQMDNCAHRRIWHSRATYMDLFRCKITRKLAPGDFIIQNNLTWAHSASNWSPASGTRKIAACFA